MTVGTSGTSKTPTPISREAALLNEAQAEIDKEMAERAKGLLKAQLRVIATMEQSLNVEKMKLADIQQRIADGAV
jgi:hypothetical protein